MLVEVSYNPRGPLSLIALSARATVAVALLCQDANVRCSPRMNCNQTLAVIGVMYTETPAKTQPRRHSSVGTHLRTQHRPVGVRRCGFTLTRHKENQKNENTTRMDVRPNICVQYKSWRNVTANQLANSSPITSNSNVKYKQMYPSTL